MKEYWSNLAAVAFLILIVGNSAGSESTQSSQESVRFKNDITWEELNRPLSLHGVDRPFGKIVEELQEQSGLQILFHASAMESGLDQDTPLDFHLESTPLATILDVMLEPWQCTYTIREGIVIIVSGEYAIENPMREVLDCSELLKSIKPRTVNRRARSYGKSGGGAFGGGGGGVFRVTNGDAAFPQQAGGGSTNDGPTATRPPPDVQYETVVIPPASQLIDLIEETVDPNSWEINGGSSYMRELNGKLIIVQTAKNLREIKILLESLK